MEWKGTEWGESNLKAETALLLIGCSTPPTPKKKTIADALQLCPRWIICDPDASTCAWIAVIHRGGPPLSALIVFVCYLWAAGKARCVVVL